MDYTLYFQSTQTGKEPENEFQYYGKNNIESWLVYKLYNDTVKNEVGNYVVKADNRIKFINDFLDYHFSRYKGDPEQFFLCLRDIIIKVIYLGQNGFIPEAKRHYSRWDKLYTPVIEKWIQKRVVLINLPAQQKDNSVSSLNKGNSDYTVKSVIIAYLYMYKKGIYPIPEITKRGERLQFYQKLADKYQMSYDSFRTDWTPLDKKEKRLMQSENIKLAIKLLYTFNDSKIKEAIELANSELKEAELKS